jgi:hypothetical protein
VKVVIVNSSLLPIINSNPQPVVSIVNAEAYPLLYGSVTGLISTPNIFLSFDGNRTYEGEGKVIFPYTGSDYEYTFYTLDSSDNIHWIYGENKSSPTSSAFPPFLINEEYSTRVSFEQANRNSGISFLAIAVAGIALTIYIQFETGKKQYSDSAKVEEQLREINHTLEKFMNSYQKDRKMKTG